MIHLRFVELLLERLRQEQVRLAALVLGSNLDHENYICLRSKHRGFLDAEAIVKKTYKDLYETIDIKTQGVTDEFSDGDEA